MTVNLNEHAFATQHDPARTQRYYYGAPRRIAERILFIKRDSRLPAYRRQLDRVEEFGNVWRGITGRYDGHDVTIIATGPAPSLIGDAVCALHLPGARCLYSGTCGGLRPDLHIADYVTPESAVCADGFSYLCGFKPLARVSANVKLAASVQRCVTRFAAPPFTGPTFTTASVVREGVPGFRDLVDADCVAIEMGAAAFFAAARTTGKIAAAYFWVTDLPYHGRSFVDELTRDDKDTKQCNHDRAPELDLQILIKM